MNPKKEYDAPELRLIGETRDVVFGMTGIGPDIAGEMIVWDMEFQTDLAPNS